jgi:acetyl-CoA carboxylase carboxyltransferase component
MKRLCARTLPQVHLYNGCCDNYAPDEDDALRQIRRFLSYMPQSVWEIPERGPVTDDPMRTEAELNAIIPNERKTSYDMRRIIELVVDKDSWFETGHRIGPAPILWGWPSWA